MRLGRFAIALTIVALGFSDGHADLVPGVISNFQSGTVEGWAGGTVANIANAGPLGAGDNALQLSNGGGGNFAMFNGTVGGVINPAVTSITADIFRPLGQADGEIRLVLFNSSSGGRWTSTNATLISGDGLWNTYSFSILESDLTHVLDAGETYGDLTNNLFRIMFRYDPGAPSAGGSPLAGTMLFDNITAAIPEPTGSAIGVLLIGAVAIRRRRRQDSCSAQLVLVGKKTER